MAPRTVSGYQRSVAKLHAMLDSACEVNSRKRCGRVMSCSNACGQKTGMVFYAISLLLEQCLVYEGSGALCTTMMSADFHPSQSSHLFHQSKRGLMLCESNLVDPVSWSTPHLRKLKATIASEEGLAIFRWFLSVQVGVAIPETSQERRTRRRETSTCSIFANANRLFEIS